MPTDRHLFQPSRWDDCCHCRFCGYPDTNPIHHSETSEEVPDGRRLGLEGRAPATTAAPIDLHQAIQAATEDVRRTGEAAPGQIITLEVAICIAVEAAAPILTQALRDKVADLEVHAAEQREALVTIAAHHADEVAFPGSPLGKVRDALAIQPPQHRQQLQDKVKRLEKFVKHVREAAARDYDTATAMLVDDALRKLDQGEAQEEAAT